MDRVRTGVPASIRWLRYAWWGLGIGAALTAWSLVSGWHLAGDDAHAYWAASLADPYRISAMGAPDAYHYAPPFLWLIAPLKLLPYEVFRPVWSGLILVALAWLVGLDLLLPVILLGPFMADYLFGNVNTFMAVAIVLSFRWPGFWAFPILTKAAGGVGMLWYAFRGEWRSLAVAAGTTMAILLVTAVVVPDQLVTWLTIVQGAPGSAADAPWMAVPPWPLRVAVAVVALWWAARTNRRWVVPLASMIALPIWPFTVAMTAGAIRLLRQASRSASVPVESPSAAGSRRHLTSPLSLPRLTVPRRTE